MKARSRDAAIRMAALALLAARDEIERQAASASDDVGVLSVCEQRQVEE